jgi:transposase-like protein
MILFYENWKRRGAYSQSVILYADFFYVRYGVSYRDLEDIMEERGVNVDHATLNRWVIRYSATNLRRDKIQGQLLNSCIIKLMNKKTEPHKKPIPDIKEIRIKNNALGKCVPLKLIMILFYENWKRRGAYPIRSVCECWVIRYSPAIAVKATSQKRETNRSWRMDETYIKVKGEWIYLYRAVDSHGDMLDFMLSERRDEEAATAY